MKYFDIIKTKLYMGALAIPLGIFSVASTSLGADGSGSSVIPFIWWLAPIASVLALLFAIYFYRKMMKSPE